MRCSSSEALPLIDASILSSKSLRAKKRLSPCERSFWHLTRVPVGPMVQHYAARNLVDVLAAGARGPDELLVDVLLANAQRLHALEQLFFFAGGDREESHRDTVSPFVFDLEFIGA